MADATYCAHCDERIIVADQSYGSHWLHTATRSVFCHPNAIPVEGETTYAEPKP